MARYRVITDWAGGGYPDLPASPDFTAPSATAAGQVAYIIASALQRPLRLVTMNDGPGILPPWTLIQGALPNIALTSVPSGLTF